MTISYEFEGRKYNVEHGEPFDRGAADSYYGRSFDPHWYPQGSYNGEKIVESEMSDDEVQAYRDGYDYNETFGDKKDWG